MFFGRGVGGTRQSMQSCGAVTNKSRPRKQALLFTKTYKDLKDLLVLVDFFRVEFAGTLNSKSCQPSIAQ